MEKARYQYKTQANRQSMLQLMGYQWQLGQLHEHHQETNFKIKEICK